MSNKKNSNFLVIVVIMIFMFLLILLLIVLNSLKKLENIEREVDNNIITPDITLEKFKTIKDIIEEYGSIYISETGSVFKTVFVSFKNDLYDENGKSNKSYFYNIVEEIEKIERKTFYLKDTNKKIEISAIYDPATDTFKILINKLENYYDVVDGETYISLNKTSERKISSLVMNNELIRTLGLNSSFYARTELGTDEKEKLENGYTSFQDGKIIAKLQEGKALNIIFKQGYEESIAYGGIKVGTDLETIANRYPIYNFGSVRQRYLGYITEFAYIFFYENEVSVYPYQYKENTYFDEYINDYFTTGNFDRLVSNFTDGWTSYFERNIDLEAKNFSISFPTRGIKINIINGNQAGITVYNNYYLSDTIKDLIKAKRVTLDSNNDLVDVVEKARRESM